MSKRLALVLALATLGGCYHGSLFAERPKDPQVDGAITRMWAAEIRKTAHDGDWILTRSLTPEGDAIATISGGEEFSHASIVDVTHDTIIEATTPAVQETSIEELLVRNWYAVVVHPAGQTDAEGRAALARARAQIGAGFDGWGFVGLQESDKWYCSELVWWASGFQARFGMPVVILPRDLMKYGEVVYYSGRRDDLQVGALAATRLNVGHDAAVANATTHGHDQGIEIDP
jgi:hypothetical protein